MRRTTVSPDRPAKAGRSTARSPRRFAVRGSAPVAALGVAAVVLVLAAPASSAVASAGASVGSEADSGLSALREVASEADGRPSVASGTPQAEPVAVAVVEQPDGSLAVQTYQAGSVAGAARVAGELARRDDVVAAGVDHRVSALAAVTPEDDIFFDCQWALHSDVEECYGLTPVRTLQAEAAWARSTGAGAVVAVVDTGVMPDHEDLQGRLLQGSDFTGASFYGDDENGHGTHVAGIIAAADNDTGVLGLAPGAKILPVRVLDADGGGSLSEIASGIVFAADQGADVINLSVGWEEDFPVVTSAVNYALTKGALVVAAAGNDYQDGNPTTYPAAIPGVLAVGATTDQGGIASFSGRKPYVGVAAPGVDIVSSYTEDAAVCLDWNACYDFLSGTSMAAPFVSAAAALLLERNPGLSQAALAAYLTGTAAPAGEAGRDPAYGFGHLNPNLALDRVIAGTARPTSLSVRPNASSVVANTRITLSATFASNGWRLARRPVEFQKYVNGSWTKIATVNTSGSGVATYSTPVGVHTKFRAVAHATPGLAQAVSASTTVAVKAKVLISGASPSADRVTVTARISPAAAVKASLQRQKNGVWTTISSKTLGSTGTTTFSNVSAPTGTRTFRVVVASSTIAHGGTSGSLTINVK